MFTKFRSKKKGPSCINNYMSLHFSTLQRVSSIRYNRNTTRSHIIPEREHKHESLRAGPEIDMRMRAGGGVLCLVMTSTEKTARDTPFLQVSVRCEGEIKGMGK